MRVGSARVSIGLVRFREIVAAELERRRRRNTRYSLRAFARGLGVHHATLSRLLKTTRPAQIQTISAIGRRLGLSSDQIATLMCREDEAAVTLAIARPTFSPDSRWLASVSGISVDRVNIALQSLLRTGRLRMLTAREWQPVQREGVD